MARVPRSLSIFSLPYRTALLPKTQHAVQPQSQHYRSYHISMPTPAISRLRPCIAVSHPVHTQVRFTSTAKRQRKMHRLPPAEFQYGPSEITGSSGKSRTAVLLKEQVRASVGAGASARADHLLFTPAPSAPNAYHTPPKFLPQDDVRKTLWEQQQQASASVQQSTSASLLNRTSTSAYQTAYPPSISPTWPAQLPLPPPVRQPYTKSYHLTPADMDEIRRLRAEDGSKWNSYALAQRFQCSRIFVGMVAQASEQRLAWEAKRQKKQMESWGPRRRKARDERQVRREAWAREV